MNDDELFAEFVRRLNTFRSTVDVDSAGITIRQWDNEMLQRPIRLHVDPPGLARNLRLMADSSGLFPDVDPLIGSMQFLLVHVEELIVTRPGRDLEFDRRGNLRPMRSRSPRDDSEHE